MHEEDPRPDENSMCTEQYFPSTRCIGVCDEEHTEEDEICLHASLSSSKAYLTDSGSSNHMFASRKSFITLPISSGPKSNMGGEYKIPNVERGSDKIQHDYFIPSPTEKQIVEDEEEADFSL